MERRAAEVAWQVDPVLLVFARGRYLSGQGYRVPDINPGKLSEASHWNVNLREVKIAYNLGRNSRTYKVVSRKLSYFPLFTQLVGLSLRKGVHWY